MQWQDAIVVAIQIRGVSEPTRSALSAEARARGESLQEYLLMCWIARHTILTTADSWPSGQPVR
jgi:hypothetical protein